MRVEHWNPNAFDKTFEDVAVERLVKAGRVLRASARRHLVSKIGGGKTTGISRPMYRKGPYAGQPWTARNFGELEKSVRLVQKEDKWGRPLARKKNVRVYAGNYLAYYADIFEFSKPFMRPALHESLPMIETTVGVKK